MFPRGKESFRQNQTQPSCRGCELCLPCARLPLPWHGQSTEGLQGDSPVLYLGTLLESEQGHWALLSQPKHHFILTGAFSILLHAAYKLPRDLRHFHSGSAGSKVQNKSRGGPCNKQTWLEVLGSGAHSAAGPTGTPSSAESCSTTSHTASG